MTVFDFSKAPYNADPSGVALATTAIQQALDDAGKSAGNTVTGQPGRYSLDAGVSLQSPFPVTFDGISRDALYLIQRAPLHNVLSIAGPNHKGSDGNTVRNVSLDTSVNTGTARSTSAKCLLIGGSHQTVEYIRATGGNADFCIMANGPGWSGGPGQGTLGLNLGNILRHVLLSETVNDDGLSWSFQGGDWLIADVQHHGSRLAVYECGEGLVDGYQYAHGAQGVHNGIWITTPSTDVTIRGFHCAKGSAPVLGQGGIWNQTTVDASRISRSITLDGFVMSATDTIKLGDVDSLLIEGSTLGNVSITPRVVCRGSVTTTTHGTVRKHPQPLSGQPAPVIAVTGL